MEREHRTRWATAILVLVVSAAAVAARGDEPEGGNETTATPGVPYTVTASCDQRAGWSEPTGEPVVSFEVVAAETGPVVLGSVIPGAGRALVSVELVELREVHWFELEKRPVDEEPLVRPVSLAVVAVDGRCADNDVASVVLELPSAEREYIIELHFLDVRTGIPVNWTFREPVRSGGEGDVVR